VSSLRASGPHRALVPAPRGVPAIEATRHASRRAAMGPAPLLSCTQRPAIPAGPQGAVQSLGLAPLPSAPGRRGRRRAAARSGPAGPRPSRAQQPASAAARVLATSGRTRHPTRGAFKPAPCSCAVHRPAPAAGAQLGARSPRVCSPRSAPLIVQSSGLLPLPFQRNSARTVLGSAPISIAAASSRGRASPRGRSRTRRLDAWQRHAVLGSAPPKRCSPRVCSPNRAVLGSAPQTVQSSGLLPKPCSPRVCSPWRGPREGPVARGPREGPSRNSEALDSAHVRREVVVRGRRRSATRPRSISRRRRASARAGACTARLWRVCFRCGTQADILCAIIRARGRPSVRLAKPSLLHVLKRLVTCVL
jgi:hypothetical protein